MRRNSNLSGFDFFDVEEAPASRAIIARDNITRELRARDPQLLSAETYIKPSGMAGVSSLVHFWSGRGWAVQSSARNATEAERIGKRVQSNLVAARNLRAADPYVHTLPLFVIYGSSYLMLEPAEKKKAEAKSVSVTDQKTHIVRKGESVFGAGSVKITGKQGAYVLGIEPTKKNLKKMFASSSVRAADLASLETKLDSAIALVQSYGF